MSTTAQKAKDTAATAIDAAAQAGRTARENVTTPAAETLESLRDAATDKAETARETLVESGDRLVNTLKDHAADASAIQARVLNGIADGVATASNSLRGRTVGELFTSAQDYARRHPGAFAAGAAVAGFALARFLRSSSSASAATAHRSVNTMGKGTGQSS